MATGGDRNDPVGTLHVTFRWRGVAPHRPGPSFRASGPIGPFGGRKASVERRKRAGTLRCRPVPVPERADLIGETGVSARPRRSGARTASANRRRSPRPYFRSWIDRGTPGGGGGDAVGDVKIPVRQTPSMSFPPLQFVSSKPANPTMW